LCNFRTIVNFISVFIFCFVILSNAAVTRLSLGHKMRFHIFHHQLAAESKI